MENEHQKKQREALEKAKNKVQDKEAKQALEKKISQLGKEVRK